MDVVEVQSLLAFATQDCRFFDFTSDSIKADMQQARGGLAVADAPTTQLTVNLDKHSQQIEIYALQFVAKGMQQVPSVASMTALSSRAKSIVARIRIGGDQQVNAAVNALNAELTKKDPKATKFDSGNLQYAEQFVDGRIKASFNQEYTEGNESVFVYGSWELPAKGDATTSVSVLRKPVQK